MCILMRWRISIRTSSIETLNIANVRFVKSAHSKYEDELYEADLIGKNITLITHFKNSQKFKQNFEIIRESIDEIL